MDTLVILALLILVAAFSANMFKIAQESERLAVFSMGRFETFKGPGLILVLPFFQQVYRLRLGDIGTLTGKNFATFDNVAIPVRNTDGLRQGEAVKISGFDGFEPKLTASALPATTICPKCGHKF